MESLGRVAPKVESHVGILNASDRVTLLGVNEVWELYRILNEEDGSVVANHVVVALLSKVLYCESTWVTIAVIGTALAGDSGEAQEYRGSLSDCVHESSLAKTVRKKIWLRNSRAFDRAEEV